MQSYFHSYKPHSFNYTISWPNNNKFISGICWTSDLDANWHMNNSRYLRECDFARMKFFLEKNIWKGLRKLKASIINGGSTIRYRKSLQFLDFFQIRSKVIINASVCSFHYWLLTCICLKCMYLSTDTLKLL